MRKSTENFYKLNERRDILEVCLVLFKRCNLNCQFCFQDKSSDIDVNYILSIPERIIGPIFELKKSRGFSSLTYRVWGGELFSDDIPDSIFEVYRKLVAGLKSVGSVLGMNTEICFTSNLIFSNVNRVKQFISETGITLATSYDPVYRFRNDEQKLCWYGNTIGLRPETVSITLTKQNIHEYISDRQHFDMLSNQTVNIEYYIFNKKYDFFKPSQDDLFRFYKYCIDNNMKNIPEIVAIVKSFKNPIGRYCTCDCSCLYLDGKLTFNCLRRSSNLPIAQFFDSCPDEDVYTDTQLAVALSRKNCLTCRHYSYCRMFCMASVLHKSYDVKRCAMSQIYEYIENGGIKW